MIRWFSFGLLLGVIVIAGILFYRMMVGFLLPLFLAAILVVMFRPVFRWFTVKFHGRKRQAAAATTAVIAAVVLLPLVGMMTLAAIEAQALIAMLGEQELGKELNKLSARMGLQYDYAEEIRYLESSLATLRDEAAQGATAKGDAAAANRMVAVVEQLRDRMSQDSKDATLVEPLHDALTALQSTSLVPEQLGTLQYQRELGVASKALRSFKVKLLGGEVNAWLTELANPTVDERTVLTNRIFVGIPGILRSVGGATTSIVAQLALGLGIMMLGVYFFLTDGPKFTETLMRLSPLDDRHERELLDEFDRISRAVVVATLLSAVAQGILAGLGFWITGLESVFLLTMTTIVFALVPFVGAATVWLPACLWLYLYEGRLGAAIGLAIYGVCVVSMADNVIKPLVLHGQSNLHPLLALLSVLGGVQAAGPIGILVGPMIVVFLQTLLNILHRELESLRRESAGSGGTRIEERG